MFKRVFIIIILLNVAGIDIISSQNLSQEIKSQFNALSFDDLDNNQLAEEMMWRVQGTDTLPEWIFETYSNKNLVLGVSLPSTDSILSRSQAIANALFSHILKNGIDVFSLTELFTYSDSESDKVTIEELKKGFVKKQFSYKVVKEYKSKFGEYFCLLNVVDDKYGVTTINCQIESYTKVSPQANVNITPEEGFYKINLGILGLPKLTNTSTNIYRSNNHIETVSSINDQEINQKKIHCTYHKYGDLSQLEYIPYAQMNKGFWYPYIIPQLMQIFYEDSDGRVQINSVMETYGEQFKEISRLMSKHKIEINPAILGIIGNNLKVEITSKREKISK